MKHQNGFTLLEAIVAIYVFLLGIVAAMTLASQSLSSAAFFKDQLTASNLAQEGAELVRAMRDTKFLTAYNGGCFPDDCDPNNAFEPTSNANGGDPHCRETGSQKGCRFTDPSAQDLTLEACGAKEPGVCEFLRRNSTTGLYGYIGTDPMTKFDRRIYTTPEVFNGRKDWIVHVIVTWQQRMGQGRYEVTTRLTPWL